MRYAIWRRFSPEARRAAATASYAPCETGVPIPRSPAGRCPLGEALAASGHPALPGPSSYDVVRYGLGVRSYERSFRARQREAQRFIRDWDTGKIDPADLPALLEVDAGGTGRARRANGEKT